MLTIGPHVIQWVGQQLDIPVYYPLMTGIGWEDGGELTVGAIFYDYTTYNINAHIAMSVGKRLPPTFIAAFLDYPFNQARVRRLTGVVPKSNWQARELAEHFGGVLEGEMKNAVEDGSMMIYGLQRRDAERWLRPVYSRRLVKEGDTVHG